MTNESISPEYSDQGYPLFLLHYGADQTYCAMAIADHLDSNILIYALPSFSPDEASLLTIEGMVARILRTIRSIQPAGPYRLIGWSLGGVIAYEVAAQLIGDDQQIEFLCLLDTFCPVQSSTPLAREVEHLDRKQQILRHVVRRSNLSPVQREALKQIDSLAGVLELATLLSMIKDHDLIAFPFAGVKLAEIELVFARNHAVSLACLRYNPKPIPIPLHLVVSQEGNSIESTLGWGAVQPSTLIRVTPVVTKHESILPTSDPHTLAKVIYRILRNRLPDRLQDLPEGNYFPRILLQSGSRERAPLFCVPGAGDNVTTFLDMISCLDSDLPIHGFQPRGSDNCLIPHSTIPAAARSYLTAIMDMNINGTVHLLGHSFGGWVVFEMAQQLCELGHDVGSLIILDSEAPDEDDHIDRDYSDIDVVLRWAEIIERLNGCVLNLSRADLEGLNDSTQSQLLRRRLISAGLLSKNSDPDLLRGPLRTFGAAIRTGYKPAKVHPIDVNLILVDDPELTPTANRIEHENRIERWKRWTTNLTYSKAEGSHLTMLKQPYAQSLARLIQNGLSKPKMKDLAIYGLPDLFYQ